MNFRPVKESSENSYWEVKCKKCGKKIITRSVAPICRNCHSRGNVIWMKCLGDKIK